MGLLPIFPESDEMDILPLLFMMAVYGFILMNASKTISDGSEMLLLMYGPGIIGGLLIPILGAIPDCAVILISGLGSGTQEEIQQQLSVGVGTLVGSTVMLLTVPWAAGIYLGRRDYDPNTGSAVIPGPKQPKLTTKSWSNCVSVLDDIPGTAKIMMLSVVSYLIIQIPAFFFKSNYDHGITAERPYALTGVVVTFVAFCAYCWFQYNSAQASEIVRRQQEAVRREHWKHSLDRKMGLEEHQELVFRTHDKDSSGYIDAAELAEALAALGLKVGRRDVKLLLDSIDVGNEQDGDAGVQDGKISLNEFKAAVNTWVKTGQNSAELQHKTEHKKNILSRQSSLNTTGITQRNNTVNNGSTTPLMADGARSYGSNNDNGNDLQLGMNALSIEADDQEEEEEEDEEEEFWHLTDTQLKFKALGLLLLGTAICTVVSDPMVDVITHVGEKIQISPFYISFVVTPLASNASEVIAGLVFARKKTTESISLTLATLHGAAVLNSTLALCIFMSLIYFRNLSWSFSAEVIAVILVVLIVGLNGLKKTIFVWQAVIVGSLYPLSILLVYLLENVGGLD